MASDKYVSRGGEKLEAAIKNFKLRIQNLVALDVGSSTGGFVDCLLENDAKKVYAVDTAYGELAWKLRNDPRVMVMERTNILYLDTLPESVDIITIDAGWTKLELVLPVVKKSLKPDGKIIALLKPHYEASKQYKGGVVPETEVKSIKEKVKSNIDDLGFKILDEMESPILGGGGNREYLILLSF